MMTGKRYSEYAVFGFIFPPDYAEYFDRKSQNEITDRMKIFVVT